MTDLKQKKILKKSKWYFVLIQGVTDLLSKFPAVTTFCIMLAAIIIADRLFNAFLFRHYAVLIKNLLGLSILAPGSVDFGFAPEVWLAVLGLVLGTLILVISIASQSTPKLIDMYLRDWGSLTFIWFLILSAGHVLGLILFGDKVTSHPSVIFNLNFLLGPAIVLSFPYALYILSYTKPNNVIKKITLINFRLIKQISKRRIAGYLQNPRIVDDYQGRLLESLNQLDDLLAYVTFKEPKDQIIKRIGESIRRYITVKAKINPSFFQLSPSARQDISFQTMVDQFSAVERSQTFYENKGFRLLGNAYVTLLADSAYDLASLCAAELSKCGETALTTADEPAIDLITVQFNTFLRFAIKDGVKNNDGRNLYNLIFHYSNYINHLIRHEREPYIERVFAYLRNYGAEIYNHSRQKAALNFIVDAFAAEMKKTLIIICGKNWKLDLQERLLKVFLELDQPPEFHVEQKDPMESARSGVRILQMGLALYYMERGMDNFVNLIVDDIMDDFSHLGEELFRRVMERAYGRLRFAGPTFWEDTDRGSVNIYYTPYGERVEPFSKIIEARMAAAS